jgi:hypothetical protein
MIKCAQDGSGKIQHDTFILFAILCVFYHFYPDVFTDKGTFVFADTGRLVLFGDYQLARKDIDKIILFRHTGMKGGIVGKA